MTKHRWGTVYFVATSWDGDTDTLEHHVLESHPNQVSSFDKAAGLWRIAGREDKAAKIEQVLDRACSPESRQILRQEDLLELKQALAGLQETLDQTQPTWFHILEQTKLEEIRSKYEAFDLEDLAGQTNYHTLGPSLHDVQDLERLVHDAHLRGVHAYIDFGR